MVSYYFFGIFLYKKITCKVTFDLKEILYTKNNCLKMTSRCLL